MKSTKTADPYLEFMDQCEVLWGLSKGHPDIRVALLDGLVAGSSDLPGEAIRTDSPDTAVVHGTHMASIIFARHGRMRGIAPDCTPVYYNLYPDSSGCSEVALAQAIEEVLRLKPHVINISSGIFAPKGEMNAELAQACDKANINGSLMIAAVGNEACNGINHPASHPEVLAVGALNKIGKSSFYNNDGPAFQGHAILAPGQQIQGLTPTGEVSTQSASSCACALVTGGVALLLSLLVQRGHDPSPVGLKTWLLQSVVKNNGQYPKAFQGVFDLIQTWKFLNSHNSNLN